MGKAGDWPVMAKEPIWAGTRARGSTGGRGAAGLLSQPGSAAVGVGRASEQLASGISGSLGSPVPTETFQGSSRSRDYQAPPRFRFSNPGT